MVFELPKCTSDEMSSLLFPRAFSMKTFWRTNIYWKYIYWISSRSSLFPFFLLGNNTFNLKITLDRHSPRPKLNDSLLPDPLHFSLPSIFKYYKGRFVNVAECSSEHWFVLEEKAEYRNKVKTTAYWMRSVQRDCVTGYNLSFWSQLRTNAGYLTYERLRHAPSVSLCQNLCKNFEPFEDYCCSVDNLECFETVRIKK